MKEIIRKILKEEVTTQQDNYQRKMIEILKREGFDARTTDQKILKYLNTVMGIVGITIKLHLRNLLNIIVGKIVKINIDT